MLSTWVKCADCRRRCPAAQGRTAAGLRASHAPMEALQAAFSGPRRRESPTRSQPTLLDLPNALLSRIIAPLSQDDKCVLAGAVDVGLALPAASRRTHQRPAAIDSALCPGDHRFQHVALVCHRLRDVCLAPELLHHVIMLVQYSSSSSPGQPAPPDPLPRLQALLSWLRRAGDGRRSHGSHVQRLDICIHSQSEEVAALVTQCLETCCMSGGSLQQLKVDRWTPACVPPGIAAMSCLERLHICRDYPDDLIATAVPRGPWLRSIRWLGLPWESLADPGNLEALRAATQLQFLCALDCLLSAATREGRTTGRPSLSGWPPTSRCAALVRGCGAESGCA